MMIMVPKKAKIRREGKCDDLLQGKCGELWRPMLLCLREGPEGGTGTPLGKNAENVSEG